MAPPMAKSTKSGSPKKSEILDGLKMRERRYVEGLVSGKSKKRAALDAGYSESMAAKATAKIEGREVRRAFQELARASVPAEKIVQRLQEGMDAVRSKPVVSGNKVIETIEEPDYRERREYLTLAAKFGGHFVDKSELEVSGGVDVSPNERIRELLRRADSRRATVSQ